MDTLRDVFLRSRDFGDRVAVRAGDHERSYVDLLDRAARLARHLARQGVRPGDRVAVMVEDGLRALEPHLATTLAGAVVVPVNARFREHELAHIVRDCGAAAIVHTTGVAGVVETCDAARGLVRVCTGGGDGAETDPAYEAVVTTGAADPPDVAPAPHDLAMIGYTSGTTGQPKGAMMSHAGGLAAMRANQVAFRVVPYGEGAFSGSISFTALMWAFVYPHLSVGASIDFLQPGLTFDRWFDRMEQHGSTFTFVPTPYMDGFAEHAARRPAAIARLASVCHSASPATPEQREAMVAVLGAAYVESYGATETLAAVAATTRLDADGSSGAEAPFSTIGRPLAPSLVLVVDEDGAVLPPGEIGEIVVDSPCLFTGYWDNEAATRTSLRDGRYFTGDLGHVDERGFLYVDGRQADLIISGGMNVYPAEVERVLAQLDGVEDVAVVGVPHDRWGESVCAVVVRAPASGLDEAAVVEHVQARLASYKKPTRVEFVDELPRNANLKVLKSVLRAGLAAV